VDFDTNVVVTTVDITTEVELFLVTDVTVGITGIVVLVGWE